MSAHPRSIERLRQRAIRDGETHAPHRQFNRPPVPLGIVTPQDDMTTLAIQVANRIRSNRHAVNCGSFVIGTDDGRVFVLKEQGVTTPALVEEHARHLVGLYAANTKDGRRAQCPKWEQILGDLREHFGSIAAVPA